jgi:hypothetical protein
MLETIRKYWIGMLVIVLVGLHASIVGVIRHQASLAKIDASCEVDLGQYLAFQIGKKVPLQMRLHAIVPLNHRMKSRQLIELNKAQIRQAIEEYLRQLDSNVLTDPYFADLKSQLMDVMVQTIGDPSIEDIVITEVRESTDSASLEFISQGHSQSPRRLVATLRSPTSEVEASEEHGDHEQDEEVVEEEAEPETKPPAAPVVKPKADSHAAAKKPSGHAAPAKKPAASGHGAAPAKPSGHGAAKPKENKKSGH